MKTKWKPMFCYEPITINGYNLVYARYDTKTGLFDFKTQKIVRGTYSATKFNVSFNPMNTLNELLDEAKEGK